MLKNICLYENLSFAGFVAPAKYFDPAPLAPAKNFDPAPGGAFTPAKFFDPAPGWALPGPTPGPGIPCQIRKTQ